MIIRWIYILLFLTCCTNNFAGDIAFMHGVASGDPLQDKVIIWSRVSTDNLLGSVVVEWRMATDTGMNNVVASGSIETSAEKDFTVKADVSGLSPDTWYYYDFHVDTVFSIRGRTRTLPTGSLNNFRIGVFSCSNFQESYYELYDHVSRRNDLDLIFHLGDYIYEKKPQDGSLPDREHIPPVNLSTLDEFRQRYAQYRSDTCLIRAHQQYPWIVTWDDHEVSGDSWQYASDRWEDSSVHMPVKRAATQAYFEWMPIRQNQLHPGRVYRDFNLGNLLDIIVLDSRHEGRIKQTGDFDAAMNDSGRTILGTDQFTWLKDKLSTSTAQWKVIANQVIMMPMQLLGVGVNPDQWDGYSWERDSLMRFLASNEIKNVVVATGDAHRSFAGDLPTPDKPYNPANGNNSQGVELVTPAISSERDEEFSPLLNLLLAGALPHLQYSELQHDGYLILDFRENKMQGDYYFIRNNRTPNSNIFFSKAWYTNDTKNHLKAWPSQSVALNQYPSLAPLWPDKNLTTGIFQMASRFASLQTFPNPTISGNNILFDLPSTAMVQLINEAGIVVVERPFSAGKQTLQVSIPAGIYYLIAKTGNTSYSSRIVIQ